MELNVFQAIILGAIQGISEFLPISSSGHLALARHLMGLQPSLAFDVLLHVGTLVSVFVIFWKDLLSLLVAACKMFWELITRGKVDMKKSEYRKLVLLIIVATIPLIGGAFLEGYFEFLAASAFAVGLALIGSGLLIHFTDKFKNAHLPLKDAGFKHAAIVGLSQLVAITPGLSRSGSTIFAGIATGLSRESAVRFSFLLSAVAILGATVMHIRDFADIVLKPSILIGTLTATIVGIAAIKWLIGLVSRGKYTILAYYCYAIGLAAIITHIF